MGKTKQSSARHDAVSAARDTTSSPIDHFPPLIIYSCLTDGSVKLAEAAETALKAGDQWLASEAITMPRKGAGPRPVTLLSPVARTVYGTLVARLSAALPEESRAPGAWEAHRNFGRTGTHTHVVDLDYASCYETIDHSTLEHELVLRSMDPDLVAKLVAFLRMVEGPRGLPQMLNASDRLADAYLSIVDRRLQRDGLTLHRYADDTRVVAGDWHQATSILEDAAVYARGYGLILAGAKTGIRRTDVVDNTERAIEEYPARHLRKAEVDLTDVVEVPSDYGPPDLAEIPPDEAVKVAAAGTSILAEWFELIRTTRPQPSGSVAATSPMPGPETAAEPVDAANLPTGMAAALGRALHWATRSAEPVDPQLLEELVFHYPLRLEDVCRYLIERSLAGQDDPTSTETVERLIGMGRQSAWAKLWLLHTCRTLWPAPPTAQDVIIAWTETQLDDNSEVVRAEAAWTAASWGRLADVAVSRLYRRATTVTHAALTACATKQSGIPKGIVDALRGDSPLNEQAHQWAR